MKKTLTAALLALALALPAAHAAPGDNAKEPKKPAATAKKDSGNKPAKKPATNPPAATKEKPFAAAVKQPATKATNDKPAADKPTRERPFGAATRTAPAAAATTAAATAPEPQQPAAAPATNDANALESFMRGTKDLQASFTQTVYNKRGQETSSGQMWVAKPGKFYWDYQRPNPQKIISNGKKVYHYDIDLEQISVRDRSELVGDIAVELLNGDDNISRNFQTNRTVKNLVPARLQKYAANGVAYRLKPKKHQEEYDSLWIVLDGNTISAVMIDGGSSQTVLTFSNMKRNAGIPAKQFEFTPPPGVDIVGK